jgi:hypothetical protein
MSPKSYYVTRQGRRWQFEVGDEQFGPYSTEGDAIAEATADARQALHEGCPAVRILAMATGGTWEVRWDSRAAVEHAQDGDAA